MVSENRLESASTRAVPAPPGTTQPSASWAWRRESGAEGALGQPRNEVARQQHRERDREQVAVLGRAGLSLNVDPSSVVSDVQEFNRYCSRCFVEHSVSAIVKSTRNVVNPTHIVDESRNPVTSQVEIGNRSI